VPGTCDRKLSTKIDVSVSPLVVTASVPIKRNRRGSGAYETVQNRPVDIWGGGGGPKLGAATLGLEGAGFPPF